MSVRVALVVLVVLVVGALLEQTPANTVGLNEPMLYRYPWQAGSSMSRTQGWGVADPSHIGYLHYAVDWDNGVPNWPVMAANGGELRCRPFSSSNPDGFGNLMVIWDPVANQTAFHAHLRLCEFFTPGVTYTVTQGQWIGFADETGDADGMHLHFHVVSGRVDEGKDDSIPFAMSDKTSFPHQEPYAIDGPSDNAGVAYTSAAIGDIDQTIRAHYVLQGGIGAWWNVGSTYRASSAGSIEFGGVCRNTTTAFVHLCGTDFGIGLIASQNYMDWKGVRRSVYRVGTTTGNVKGQIQGALSNGYLGGAVSKVMGAPTSSESNGVQFFQGGYIARAPTASQHVRVEVYRCVQFGCSLSLIARYSSLGEFCPSVDADRYVTSLDMTAVIEAMDSTDMNYDLNGDGVVTATDQAMLITRLDAECLVADP